MHTIVRKINHLKRIICNWKRSKSRKFLTNLQSKIESKSHKNEYMYVEKITGFDSKQFEDFYCYTTSKNPSVSIKSKQYRFV